MKFLSLFFWLVCAAYQFSATGRAYGHGFAGVRFFPATLSTDDPFVADELSLPSVSTFKESDGSRRTDISVDFAKIIFPRFGIGVAETYTFLRSSDGDSISGFQNLELGSKYEVLVSPEHEAIVSFGLNLELGGSGRRSVGVAPYSTLSPVLYFGKGFGDLPERL